MVPMPSASACSERSPAAGTLSLVRSLRAGLVGVWLLAGLPLMGCAHSTTQKSAPTSMLEINSETRDADVWVDGQYIGQVEQVSGKLGLTPGVHRVEIRKPGHFPVQRTVRVDKRAGGIVQLSAEMLQDPR